jgi:uncharacterized damage-inducible protein DinB
MNRPEELLFLFRRDLESLRKELSAFKPEELLWTTTPGITNSAGNLTLHLCGNLRHYIGAVLGKNGYVRNRDAEFSTVNLSCEELFKIMDATGLELEKTLKNLNPQQLEEDFPMEVLNRKWKTETFILHLYGHFNYHIGQINYLRRFLSAGPT